jgi:acetyltransferase-like isoleucine patch superfamily enzyme
MIIIAPSARVSDKADIEDSVRGTRIVIEANVMIDAFVKIKAAGGSGDVVIGEGSYVNSGTVIYSGNGVTIGKEVLIAANCTLAPVNHAYKLRSKTILEQRLLPSKGGIIIEDDVWLAAGVVVLDGARIRRGCVIAANAVVRGETEEYGVYGGQPFVRIGTREG